MLKIRLQRVGRKHEPTFRIVLTDSKNSTKSGRFLEVLGSHDPRRDSATEIKADRVKHWISQGAQPSATLHNLFIEKKITTGKKINVLPKKTVPKKEEAPAASPAQAASGEAPKAEAAPAEAPKTEEAAQ